MFFLLTWLFDERLGKRFIGSSMIYLLPGMGATAEMYGEDWRRMNDLCLVDWPDYTGQTSLEEIADILIKKYGMTSSDIVGGSSLGGMVACVIAERCQMKHLILLGSAKEPSEVQAILKFSHGLVRITPLAWVQKLVGKREELLIEMFKQTDPDFIRAMCLAIFKWKGLKDKSIKILRVHGRLDVAIPLPSYVDQILDGGHLIAMTHQNDVVKIVEAWIDKQMDK